MSPSPRVPRRRTPARLLLTAVLGAALSATVPAAAANATEPTRTTTHVVSTLSRTCDSGVVLRSTFVVVREITTFYDADGTPVSQLWRAIIDGVTVNTLTGASLTNHGLRIFHRDLLTGELFTTGPNTFTRLPDGGVAIPGAGRLVFDSTGQLVEHDGPDSTAEQAEVCAALGA